MLRPGWPAMTGAETVDAIRRLGRDVVPAIKAVPPRTTIPEECLEAPAGANDPYYTDLPAFPDPETWTLNHVLRHHAAGGPTRFLDLPEEGDLDLRRGAGVLRGRRERRRRRRRP